MNDLAYMLRSLQIRCKESISGPGYCSFLTAHGMTAGIQGDVEGVTSVTTAWLRWSASIGDSGIDRELAVWLCGFHVRPFSAL